MKRVGNVVSPYQAVTYSTLFKQFLLLSFLISGENLHTIVFYKNKRRHHAKGK